MDVRLFKSAEILYHECEELIANVEDRFWLINSIPSTPFNLPAFQAEEALLQFDYGLQMTLYAVASTTLVNGKIAMQNQLMDKSGSDIDFIKNIVKHGDIFSDKIVEAEINILRIPVGWDNISAIQPQSLISLMMKYVHPVVADCIRCVVLSDSLIGKSGPGTVMYQMENNVRRIAEYFCGLNGNPNDNLINIMVWIKSIWMDTRINFENKFNKN